jgi:hypothetical protein
MSLEARERGPEVSFQLALLITGVALAYWVDLGFVQGLDRHPWLWRIPLAMQSCVAIFSASLLFFLPDTPRWYYARGHSDRGDDVLARLHALPIDHPAVQFVKSEIVASLQEEDAEVNLNWWCLFWDNTELQFGRRLRTSFLINWVGAFLNAYLRRGYLLIIQTTRHNSFLESTCWYTSAPRSSPTLITRLNYPESWPAC